MSGITDEVKPIADRLTNIISSVFKGADIDKVISDTMKDLQPLFDGINDLITGCLMLGKAWELFTGAFGGKGGQGSDSLVTGNSQLQMVVKTVSDVGKIFEWLAEIVLVAVAIYAKCGNNFGAVTEEFGMLILGKMIDFGQKILTFMADLGKQLIDIGIDIGVGFANGLIGAINNGMNSMVGSINNWINSLPSIVRSVMGIGDTSWGGISLIDGDALKKTFNDNMDANLASLNAQIDAWQKKYGIDLTLNDLASKYGVDLDAFKHMFDDAVGDNSPIMDPTTGLPSLNDSLNDLKDTINGKNMASNINLYFDVHDVNASDAASVQALGDQLQQKVLDQLIRRGVIPG